MITRTIRLKKLPSGRQVVVYTGFIEGFEPCIIKHKRKRGLKLAPRSLRMIPRRTKFNA